MRQVPKADGLRPEHIVVTTAGKARAVLMDAWGRVYRLRRRTTVGRDETLVDIAIKDEAVSKLHAELIYRPERDEWCVVDADSTNGTFVEGQRVVGTASLRTGQLLMFGDVAFLFVVRP